MGLDLKDRKLLCELDKNSRQSSTQISKRIKLNKNTTNFRTNRLIKEKYILGFYPSIDISKLGYFAFRIYFKFINTTPANEKEILSKLKTNKLVGVVAELDAIYDVMFMVIVKDIYEFDNFWQSFKEKYRKYFWKEKINVITKIIHLKRHYLLKNKILSTAEIVGGEKKEKFDEKDIKILSLLSKNCRIPILTISDKLKIPPKTIAFRIKQLEKKGIIQGYRVNLNLTKLGYSYYKINFRFRKNPKIEELIKYAKYNPNIIFVNFTISDYDFEIDVEIENKEKLINLINKIKTKFKQVMDYEIMIFRKYHKIESIPFLYYKPK